MKPQIKIKYDITPENAKDRGYEFVQDVIYDPEAPEGAMNDILEYLEIDWILGSPVLNEIENGFCGLYKPLVKK